VLDPSGGSDFPSPRSERQEGPPSRLSKGWETESGDVQYYPTTWPSAKRLSDVIPTSSGGTAGGGVAPGTKDWLQLLPHALSPRGRARRRGTLRLLQAGLFPQAGDAGQERDTYSPRKAASHRRGSPSGRATTAIHTLAGWLQRRRRRVRSTTSSTAGYWRQLTRFEG
jgi:hypothetical protein